MRGNTPHPKPALRSGFDLSPPGRGENAPLQLHPDLGSDALSFVERHGLWSQEQKEAAARLRRIVEEQKLEVIRLSFPDQHGNGCDQAGAEAGSHGAFSPLPGGERSKPERSAGFG